MLVLDRAVLLQKAFAAEPGNAETAYNIGEFYRVQSFEGGTSNEEQAETAIEWFGRAITLNPLDGYGYLRMGMCLDWLGRTNESAKFYSKAEALDPNGYYTVANIGWHYVQIGDYAAANEWFQRSLGLMWDKDNAIAGSYSQIVRKKLLEKASGNGPLLPGY